MPITRELTQDELQHIASQGIDPNLYAGKQVTLATDEELSKQQPQAQSGYKYSTTGAIGKSLQQKTGSIVGGGAGAIGTGALLTSLGLAPFTEGVSLIPSVLGLTGIALMAGAGSGLGQKEQEKIEGPEVSQRLQQEATQAQSEYPIATTVGDVTANAFASGGSFSPRTAVGGVKGILAKLIGKELTQQAAKDAANVAIQAGIMPAINTGLSLAEGKGMPSIGEIGKQMVAGALFAKPNALRRLAGRIGGESSKAEPPLTTPKEEPVTTPKEEPVTKPVLSPFKETDPEGKPVIADSDVKALWLKAHPKPTPTPGVDPLTDTDYYKAKNSWQQANRDIEGQRDWAHNAFIEAQKEPKTIVPETQPEIKIPATGEPLKKAEPETSTPKEVPVQSGTQDLEALRKGVEASNEEFARQQKIEDFKKAQEEVAQQKASEVVQSGIENPKDRTYQNLELLKSVKEQDSERALMEQKRLIDAATKPPPIEPLPPRKTAPLHLIDPLSLRKRILESNVGRQQTPLPENVAKEMEVDKNRYAPPSDYDRFQELNAQRKVLMDKKDYQSPEFMKIWKEMEEIKNRQPGEGKGKPPKLDPNTTIGKNVGEELSILSQHPEVGSIAKALKLDSESLKTPVNTIDTNRSRWSKENGIELRSGENVWTRLHEIIHAATSKKIEQLGENHPLVKELNGLLEEARTKLQQKDLYGLKDVHEFLAEAVSNKEFQAKLASIESGPKTLWGKFVESIRKILGVEKTHDTLLEKVLRPTKELIEKDTNATSNRNITENNISEHLRANEGERGAKNNQEVREGEGKKTSNSNHYAPEQKEEIERPYQLHLTEPTLDRIRDHPNPLGRKLADASQRVLQGVQEQLGWTQNKLQSFIRELGLTKDDKAHLEAVRNYDNLNGKLPKDAFQNERQKKAWETERAIYKKMGEERRKVNEPVMRGNTPTVLKIDEHSHPTTLDDKYSEMLRKGTDTAGIKDFSDKYITYAKKQGYTQQEATESLQNIRDSIQGSMKNDAGNMQYFNAIRRSQGIKLPPEFIKKGWDTNLETYYNRAARDMNFYKFVESNPEAMSALGMKTDSWQRPIPKDPQGGIANDPSVRTLIQEFRGNRSTSGERTEEALSSAITRVFISSPGLQAHILGSNIIGMASQGENPYQSARIIGAAIKSVREGYQHSVENGVYKYTAKSASAMLDNNLTLAQRLQGFSRMIGQISTLGDLTTKFNAGLLQAGCESSVRHKLELASQGDKAAMQFIKKLDPTYTKDRIYSPEEQIKLASTAVGFIHGTGDARTMPPWMLNDSELSGFFTLAHWSVAQTNKFMTDFYTPARNGNFGPLANALFGSAIGGYFVKKLREEISGRKPQIPSLPEIAAGEGGLANHKSLVLYNMIAGMQYAGFGGLLSQAAKYPFDFAYKNTPMGAAFPIEELASNTAEMVKDLTTAAANDPHFDWGHAAMHVAQHVLTDSFQLGRIGYNQAINNGLITGEMAEKRQLADKMNQLRRFNMVEGLPYNEIDEGSNPYMNLEQKSFKLEQDPQKAMQMLPKLINTIVTTYGDKPDVMMEKLKALKQNSYATMPSLESMPLSFMKYVGYLDRLEGPGKGQEAFMDYMKHKVINEAKASVVP